VPATPGLSAPEMLDAAARGALDVFYIAGGNFLDTLPEPARMRAALERVPLRIHQDLFLNTSMLVDPGESVLLLPGQTRYEQRGGGTLTSTERRIRFSPEIPGPRIGEAMAEWEIFMRIGEAALGPAKRHLVHFDDAAAIRAEMERVMPIYTGIASLAKENDSVQYGGALLCANGVCASLPGGRARFTPLAPPNLRAPNPQLVIPSRPATPADEESQRPAQTQLFYLTTRRGRQFNSIVYADRDPLTGARRRDEIFIAPEDAARLGLRDGDLVTLRATSNHSSAFRGVCCIARVAPGTLQAFWPEANVLIASRLDPQSHEPDYNAWVTMEKLSTG
jgi:anaerobic selenocysteine-containing dehydrogenase